MKLEDIIEGCKAGKNKSQESLVHQFAPSLLAICQRYCRERSLAHDALQETFINVFKYIGTYNSSGSFEGWLKRIAVNASIQILKKYKPYDFKEDQQFDQFVDAQVPDINSTLNTREILALIDRLPKSLAMVFNLYVVEGYSHKEIGDILNITSSTSRSHLTKARVKMIDLLKEENIDIGKTSYF